MMGETSRPVRRSYLDVLRGVAVLVMVLAHTSDAWTMADALYAVLCVGLTALVIAWRGWSSGRTNERRVTGRIEPVQATHSVPNS